MELVTSGAEDDAMSTDRNPFYPWSFHYGEFKIHLLNLLQSPSLDLMDCFRHPNSFSPQTPNRHQDRRPLRPLFPKNLIICIIVCIPHMTHHMQSSRGSQLSCFMKCLSPSLSHPLSLFGRLIPMHNSHAAQYRSHSLNLLHSFACDTLRLTPFDSNDSLLVQLTPDHSRYAQHFAVIHSIPDSMHSCPSCI